MTTNNSLITIERSILNQALHEIKALRKTNEVMGARLQMFDDMMSVLHGQAASRNSGGMSPDIAFEIEKVLTTKEKE